MIRRITHCHDHTTSRYLICNPKTERWCIVRTRIIHRQLFALLPKPAHSDVHRMLFHKDIIALSFKNNNKGKVSYSEQMKKAESKKHDIPFISVHLHNNWKILASFPPPKTKVTCLMVVFSGRNQYDLWISVSRTSR